MWTRHAMTLGCLCMLVAPSEANRNTTVIASLTAHVSQVTLPVRLARDRQVDKAEDTREADREKAGASSSKDDMMVGLLLVLFGLRQ